jgi:hypothetical protein
MIEPHDSEGDAAERRRIQRGRNVALGLILGAFVILVFAISLVKMS